MARIAKSEDIVPSTLDPGTRQALVDGLYQVHCEVFDGVSKDSFRKYGIDSKAEKTWINLRRSAHGELVGCFAFHVVARAPTLIDTEGPLALIAQGPARIVRVPRTGQRPD